MGGQQAEDMLGCCVHLFQTDSRTGDCVKSDGIDYNIFYLNIVTIPSISYYKLHHDLGFSAKVVNNAADWKNPLDEIVKCHDLMQNEFKLFCNWKFRNLTLMRHLPLLDPHDRRLAHGDRPRSSHALEPCPGRRWHEQPQRLYERSLPCCSTRLPWHGVLPYPEA
jgi:hypothetical protein